MSRPKRCRRIEQLPGPLCFKPAGIPGHTLKSVTLTLDEFEALRLADHEHLYQEEAAQRMEVSRQTFGRIINAAHTKIADALINQKQLNIEGGTVKMAGTRIFKCTACAHEWQMPFGSGCPTGCPTCSSDAFQRINPKELCDNEACGCEHEHKHRHGQCHSIEE